MRRLTETIAPGQEGAAVQTILRQGLGLSAAGVRRAKSRPDGILLDGVPVFTNQRVRAGQVLSVVVGDQGGSDQIAPVPGPLAIVYEDEDLVIVDKAGGVPVHPSQGHHGDTLANFLLAYYAAQGLVAAFHPVNRLDRGTSGLMAVAKHAHAHEKLQEQLQNGQLRRTYLAVCEGVPVPRRGCVDEPIARVPGEVLRRQVCHQGAAARTHYEVLRTGLGPPDLGDRQDPPDPGPPVPSGLSADGGFSLRAGDPRPAPAVCSAFRRPPAAPAGDRAGDGLFFAPASVAGGVVDQ